MARLVHQPRARRIGVVCVSVVGRAPGSFARCSASTPASSSVSSRSCCLCSRSWGGRSAGDHGIKNGRIFGRIANDLLGVKAYKRGDLYFLQEEEITDWLITLPDGSEEGNVVGKFLDEWQKTRRGR
jgi:hypothetical protein